ncbi:tripartite tricarboxylate transporter permease [Halostagnicola bangensis]
MLAGIMEAAIAGMATIFSWPTILFVLVGTLLGMFFGAVPGLGGVIILALLLPFTTGLDATMTMALFGGALGGVAFGGSISAILINIPGTAPNAATCLDGYPMSRNGESEKAIGASATSSALGAIFGIGVLILLIPVAQAIVLSFASPEFFMLAVMGICVIAFITKGNFLKGIIAGCLGMLLAFIGYSPQTGHVRYNFVESVGLSQWNFFLFDGLELVAVVIGIFALSEAMYLIYSPRDQIADPELTGSSGQLIDGVKAVLKRPSLFFQSSLVGVIVGLVPGVGGSVANFLSYMRARQSSQNPEQFGQGDVRGVIAAESSNDAKDGGTLLPTLAFGIPGSPVTAIVLGALIMHGTRPGPNLLDQELEIVFALMISLLVANLMTSSLGMLLAKPLSKITVISTSYFIPGILVISTFGAYAVNQSVGDVVVAYLLGVVAFGMILYNYSRIAFLLGFILAPIAETNLHQSLQAYGDGYMIFITRPISLLLLLLIVLIFVSPFLKEYSRKK